MPKRRLNFLDTSAIKQVICGKVTPEHVWGCHNTYFFPQAFNSGQNAASIYFLVESV